MTKLQHALRKLGDPKRAKTSQSFFKTGPGEYGEGDVFIGVTMPDLRKVAKVFLQTPFSELELLLQSEVHEDRLVALVILTEQYKKASSSEQKKLTRFYLNHRDRVNNWDLVDVSAPTLLGQSLVEGDRGVLNRLIASRVLWDRRIAMVSTWALIRNGEVDDVFRLAQRLFQDPEDLLHKAAGWMLREAGKVDEPALRTFLEKDATNMPRTMLRYAIERFSPEDRKRFLGKKPTLKKGVQ